jgi:hypothetical protein
MLYPLSYEGCAVHRSCVPRVSSSHRHLGPLARVHLGIDHMTPLCAG